jgi:hypothetical protein
MSEELLARIIASVSALAKGPGAIIEAVGEQSDLVTLESVVAKATGNGLEAATLGEVATVVISFLEEAADSLEQEPAGTTVPNRAKAARAALSLKPELVNHPFQAVKGRSGRQGTIAEWLDISKENLELERAGGSTPLSDLIYPMAQHLVRRENTYRIEERRLVQRAHRPPLESAMRVEWLGRFERYYKIWAPISGLRHDLELALNAIRSDDNTNTDLFVRKSLYHYAAYLTDLESFVSERGGLWVLPDTKTEDAIADATWFLRKPIPIGEVGESMLRMTFGGAPELALFMHMTYVSQHLQPILNVWHEWVFSCHCVRLKHPRKDCKVHATIEWARFYMAALNAQWDFLADWYDLPRPGTQIDPVRQARSGLPVFPPPLPVDNNRKRR